MIKPKPQFDYDMPLTSVVADAIFTADMDGATYEDLAKAALRAREEYALSFEKTALAMLELKTNLARDRNNDQEDDGA